MTKEIVLISYFDAFGNNPLNHSENVSKILQDKFQNREDVELKFCKLRTVFDKSFYELQNCLQELTKVPSLVIGLGESNCNLKVETMARNKDSTEGPDNEGIERINTPIILNAPNEIGFNYPLAAMYCSLDQMEKKFLEISNDAGGFVCNNIAYQFSYTYPEISFGFIHVPAHYCRDLKYKTDQSIEILAKFISTSLTSKNIERLKTRKIDLKKLRIQYQNDPCLSDFYKRTKGIDEKGL